MNPSRCFRLALVCLALAGPIRADWIDVSTEALGDGWTRYTYTLDGDRFDDLTSFVLDCPALKEFRLYDLPDDCIGYAVAGAIYFARDVYWGSRGGDLVFAFDAKNDPGQVFYCLNTVCDRDRGIVTGPGVTAANPVRTPEPTTLMLLGLGGACCWVLRRSANLTA